MKFNPNDAYKDLYVYMALEHGLMMDQIDLEEVVRICKNVIDKSDSKEQLEHTELGQA